MKLQKIYACRLIDASWLLGLGLIGGCATSHPTPQHPDEVDSVVRALTTNGFGTINVSQDRTKGVMTLTGNVQSQARKTYAEQIVRVNAGDYMIADELIVSPPPPTAAQLTEDKFKSSLQAHGELDLQEIHYEAKNGTLILSGSVHTAHQRAEVVRLAREVPNIDRVVDQIKVRP